MTGKQLAPGLKLMKRKNGRIDSYWVAAEELVQKGYPIKTQRLIGDPNDPADFIIMADHCQRLQAEMLQWADGERSVGSRFERDTIGWFCESFETDEDSPFREKRQATQVFYSRYLKIIKQSVGNKRTSRVIGKDLRRWHKEWLAVIGERGAYACVQTIRRVMKYGGADLGDSDCRQLSKIFSDITFSAPSSRKVRPTYEQIVALRKAAHESGFPSIAMATSLQFDLSLRQKDVIGEWVPGEGGIVRNGRHWQMGLSWDHINSDWDMRKPTSKSNGDMIAEHKITDYPDTLKELQLIPRERRIGPVIIDESTGRPYSASRFSRRFRMIADKAGWPKGLFNMDSRAGAVSEALSAGAEATDVMRAATHQQLSTTMIYNRETIEQSSRVAQLRLARRSEQTKNKAR